uniref:Zinc finger CCCH domain-containing protein 19 n=2 Tax=Anthurium amnicola TaxID=1678845 RepID=A0A1D1XLK7_9ARAE
MALQVVRVNESLENEKLRLSHLRDRASEKGRRKELRECVEKLQLLNSPEERSRRLNDIPEVHVDPNMDPNYESAEEELVDKKRDSFNRSTDSKFSKMGRDLNASRRGNLGSSDSWTGSRRGSTTRESSKNVPSRGAWDKIGTSGGSVDSVNEVTLNQDKDLYQANSWDMPKSMAAAAVTDAGAWSNGQAGIRPGQSSCLASETSTSQCAEATNMSNINENEKLWHYQDPSGKIQGPFSMTQLRKWNTTGYFPANLRIWRTLEKQEDSILLTDALIGKFQKENPPSEAQHNTSAQFPKFAPAMDARENNGEGNWRANNNSWAEKNKDEGNSSRNDTNFSGGNTNSGLAKADGWGGQSSAWSSPNMSPVVPRDGKVGGPSHVWEPSLHPNPWSGQSHIHGAPPPSAAPFSGNSYQLSAHQGRGRGGNPGRWKGGPSHGNNWGSNRPTAFHPSGHGHGHGHGRPHSANYVYPGHQSPGELWKAQGTSNSNNWGSDSLNLPTPTPRPGGGGWMGNPITGNQPSASPNVSVQPATSGWANTATQGGNSRQFPCVGGTDASRSFSAWVEQPPSTAHALTCWGQNPPLVKQTEMAASWDSSATATISVAKESTVAGGLSAPQTPTPYLQTATSVFDRQTSLANASASEVPPKDEMVKSSDGKMDGFVSNIIPRDFQKNRHMKDDCPSPTPKAEQAKFDALISESSHQNNVDVALIRKSSETHDAAAIGSPIRSVDGGQCDTTVASPATLETSKFSANNSPGSGRMEGKGEVLAENMIITEGISLTLPLESVEPEMQNKLVAIANQADPSLYLASGTKSGPSSNENSTSKPAGGADDLELPSSQKQLVEASDPKYCSKSQGKASNLSKSQETDTMVLNPAIKGDGLEQSRSLNPRQFYALDPEKSGNLGLPAETTEWSMPSPTPPIEPSGSPAGAQSAFGVSPSSYQWNSNVHLESVSLSNAGQGTGNNEITHMGVGICQENMNKGLEPAKESGHIDLGVVVQGTTSAGLGTAAVQGNTSGVWANPVQGNTNVNAGFVAPPQGNTNMNMLWVALTQANPGWGTPVQGNPNPNPGWVLTAPMNSPPVSNWGAVVPPGNPNANQNWVPVQVNTNPVSGWAASQNSANPNAGWFGHGNTNMGCNVPAGNPGSWGTQQKLNGDGYSGHSGRGIQSNDANHGAARHGWNRSQNSGGASRPPPGVQRVAICKYHESGHCKKGAHCNYLHT